MRTDVIVDLVFGEGDKTAICMLLSSQLLTLSQLLDKDL